jgi:uncharacterized DUF497 family protein
MPEFEWDEDKPAANWRDQRIRIISARRAERHEQDDYYRENSP